MEANVGLFENHRQNNLESVVALIEDVLMQLGHFLSECREDHPNALRAWRTRRGSSETLLALFDREEFTHLIVESTALTLNDTVDDRALFRFILELNHDAIHGAAFAVSGPFVKLVAERSCIDVDGRGILDIITRVHNYVDEYAAVLAEQFGATPGTGN